MKNTSLFLNIVLLIAVAILFYLQFSSTEENKPDKPATPQFIAGNSDVRIAFVDLEKLLNEYELASKLNDDYSKSMDVAQTELEKQVSAYERDAKAFQKKVELGTFLSQRSAENQQQALLERQQELQMLQIELENKLFEDQQKLNIQLYDSVMNYLNEFNKVQNFNYIFSKMDGGNLLIGDPAMEITDNVITALNERYQALTTEE